MTTAKTMNANLKSMLDTLGVDSQVQATLESKHGVVDYKTLKAKQYHLDRKQLDDDIDKDVQVIVGAALFYADTLQKTHGYKDPLARFTKQGWMDFAATTGMHPSAIDVPDSDDDEDDEPVAPLRKITLESELVDATLANGNTTLNNNASGENMEVDEMDEDDALRVSHQRAPRKKVKKAFDDDEEDDDNEDGDQKEQLTFGMMPQGFTSGEDLLMNIGEFGNPNKKENIELEFVYTALGKCFHKGKCYHYTSDSGQSFVVGIKCFKSKKTALCVEVKHISETYLGQNDNGSFAKAVSTHYDSMYTQVTPILPVAVASLGEESADPVDLPKLIYEPQKTYSKMELAYVRDNDGGNVVRVPREDIRLIEGFSGAVSSTLA